MQGAKLLGIKNVKNIIAVSSCKGGVGKSLVAVNTAASLQRLGHKVGIFDADLYGPSLPTMCRLPEEETVLRPNEDGFALPPTFHGMKLMSFGYLPTKSAGGSESTAAVMRGPRASAVMSQLIGTTAWGELDYLVIDMPPGTGDIPLTLCQQLSLTSAIVVTTPARLSIVDVVKGMDMFDDLKVPVHAVVENMSHFDGDDGKRYFPFGQGHVEGLVNDRNIDPKSTFSLPINEVFCLSSDDGVPIPFMGEPSTIDAGVSKASDIFSDIAEHVANRIESDRIEKVKSMERPNVFYDDKRGAIVLRYLAGELEGREYVVNAATLRRESRDAKSIHELTGKQLLDKDSVPDDIAPLQITPQGNYGIAIAWDDGHDDAIYTYEQIRELVDAENGNATGTFNDQPVERKLRRD